MTKRGQGPIGDPSAALSSVLQRTAVLIPDDECAPSPLLNCRPPVCKHGLRAPSASARKNHGCSGPLAREPQGRARTDIDPALVSRQAI
jgi:hypothetical protein